MPFQSADHSMSDIAYYYTNPFDTRLFAGLSHLIPTAKETVHHQRTDVNIFLSYPPASELLEAELTEYRMAVAGVRSSAAALGTPAARADCKADSATRFPSDIHAIAERRPPSPRPSLGFDDTDGARKFGELVSKDDQLLLRRLHARQFLADSDSPGGLPATRAASRFGSAAFASDVCGGTASAVLAQKSYPDRRGDADGIWSAPGCGCQACDGLLPPVSGMNSASQQAVAAVCTTGRNIMAGDAAVASALCDAGRGKLAPATLCRIKSMSDPNLYSAWMHAAVATVKEESCTRALRADIECGGGSGGVLPMMQSPAVAAAHAVCGGGSPAGAYWSRGSCGGTEGFARSHQPSAATRPMTQQPQPAAAATLAYATTDCIFRGGGGLSGSSFTALGAASRTTSRTASASLSPLCGGGGSGALQWPGSCWVYDERGTSRQLLVSGCQAQQQQPRLQYLSGSTLQHTRNGIASGALAAAAARQLGATPPLNSAAGVVRYGQFLHRNYTATGSSLLTAATSTTSSGGGSFAAIAPSFSVAPGRMQLTSQSLKPQTYSTCYAKYQQQNVTAATTQQQQPHPSHGGHYQATCTQWQVGVYKTTRQSSAGLQQVMAAPAELSSYRAAAAAGAHQHRIAAGYHHHHYHHNQQQQQQQQDSAAAVGPVASAGSRPSASSANSVAAATAAADNSAERALAALNSVLSKGFDDGAPAPCAFDCRREGGIVACAPSPFAKADARDAFCCAPDGVRGSGLESDEGASSFVLGGSPFDGGVYVSGSGGGGRDHLRQQPLDLLLLHADLGCGGSRRPIADDVAGSAAGAPPSCGDAQQSPAAALSVDGRLAFDGVAGSAGASNIGEAVLTEEDGTAVSVDAAELAAAAAATVGGAPAAGSSASELGYAARPLNFQTIRTKRGVVQRLTFGGGYC